MADELEDFMLAGYDDDDGTSAVKEPRAVKPPPTKPKKALKAGQDTNTLPTPPRTAGTQQQKYRAANTKPHSNTNSKENTNSKPNATTRANEKTKPNEHTKPNEKTKPNEHTKPKEQTNTNEHTKTTKNTTNKEQKKHKAQQEKTKQDRVTAQALAEVRGRVFSKFYRIETLSRAIQTAADAGRPVMDLEADVAQIYSEISLLEDTTLSKMLCTPEKWGEMEREAQMVAEARVKNTKVPTPRLHGTPTTGTKPSPPVTPGFTDPKDPLWRLHVDWQARQVAREALVVAQAREQPSGGSGATERPSIFSRMNTTPCNRGCKYGSHAEGKTCPALKFECHSCKQKGHFGGSPICPKYDPNFKKGSRKAEIEANRAKFKKARIE